MKPADTVSQLDQTLNTGWVVHVYDGNRRLLLTLEPAHAWAFLVGAIAGLTIAAVGYNLKLPSSALPPATEHTPMSAPLQLD
ncbi:MAG: hypothetical protein HC886_09805 [Leptolyngbyaceae cyanobacterium SM1_1_3]|nr:hypothetical protein [Leptolyngbyaceae cyanobacterium SM1_1_3]NJN02628.1 hypothetical protein [Leptolyngbyaceae cyanobacterium RM1_1_2]NJO09968.1 hypothetical protein [Leptolyngbyaceae cyanobacterium SL_1_1]